tara:strand:+ start:619 stop:1479 length:861 start_codon:yes stop_codon:yes gene_type:complete
VLRFLTAIILIGSAFTCAFAESIIEPIISEASVSLPRSKMVTIEDTGTARKYTLLIQLPKSYNTSTSKEYPVIYTTDAPYSFPIIVGSMRLPVNVGQMEEAVIVGLSYSLESKGVESRVRDYTPVIAESWKLETGLAAEYLSFIRRDVFTFIESTYRVDANRRTFIGHSLGGLFGGYVLMQSPETFSNYVLISPSVWFNEDYLLTLEMAETQTPKHVYIGVGSFETPEFGEGQDMVAGSKALADKISAKADKNISLQLHVIDGVAHATIFPTVAIQGLDWILGTRR